MSRPKNKNKKTSRNTPRSGESRPAKPVPNARSGPRPVGGPQAFIESLAAGTRPMRPGARPEPRSDSRSGTRPESRPDARRDSRPGSRPDSRPGFKSDSRPGSRPDSRSSFKTDSRPGSRPDSRSGFRPDSKPGAKGGKDFRSDRGPRPDRDSRPSRDFRPSREASPAAEVEGGKATHLLTVKARVEKNARGFGFLVLEGTAHEDIFMPPREVAQFFHGDRVEARINTRGELIGVRLLEHRFKEVTGKFEPLVQKGGGRKYAAESNKKTGYLIFERKKTREEVFIPNVPAGVMPGDWIQAKLIYGEGRDGVTGEVTEVYGQELPPSSDIKIISSELGLKEGHTEAAIQEARSFGREVSHEEILKRVDLRELPLITIDGETARDFDDAVYVERKKSGFILWVAIADVSHYVTEKSHLDEEAREKSTSVYFPERAFHMLPGALSEELCSLKPNVARLAFVAKIEYDHRGVRGETELMEAVIQSKRRATYNEIEAEYQKKEPNWAYTPHFDLYQLIRKQRSARGSIDFDFPEAEIRCQPGGEVDYIRTRARLEAHRLIEEFMVSANEAVTDWMLQRKWPFVYRIHEIPARQALEKFQKLAKTVGFDFRVDDADSPQVLAQLVRKFQGHPAEALLNISLLRSLKQAMYSSIHGIHYGLASEGYTHFTSPIRRYPDLIVHRLLRRALRVEAGKEKFPEGKDLKLLDKDLALICDHSSYRERLATEAERESIKLKQARLMSRHLGDEFEGSINGMIENGFFVRVDDPYVEGMVSKENMGNDFFQFKDDKMQFLGTRTRRVFKMGDRVKVKVLRADIEKRTIDFGLILGEEQIPSPYDPDPIVDAAPRIKVKLPERGSRGDAPPKRSGHHDNRDKQGPAPKSGKGPRKRGRR